MSNYCTKEFTLSVVAPIAWSVSECWGFVYALNFTASGINADWTSPDCRENVLGAGYSQWLFCLNAVATIGPFDSDRVISVTGSTTLTAPAFAFYPFFPIVSIGWSYFDASMTGLIGYSGNVSLHAEDPPAPLGSGTYPVALSGTLPSGVQTLLTITLDGGGPPALAPTKPQTSGSLTIAIV